MKTITVTGRYLGGALFTPKLVGNDAAPKYSATIALDDGQEAKVMALLQEAVETKWGATPPKKVEIHGPQMGEDPDFASFGKYYINPKAPSQGKNGPLPGPATLIKTNGVTSPAGPETIYAGCHVAVSVEAFAYDENKAKRISAGATLSLRGVLFLRHGERLGYQFNPDEAFGGFESETEAETDPLLG